MGTFRSDCYHRCDYEFRLLVNRQDDGRANGRAEKTIISVAIATNECRWSAFAMDLNFVSCIWNPRQPTVITFYVCILPLFSLSLSVSLCITIFQFFSFRFHAIRLFGSHVRGIMCVCGLSLYIRNTKCPFDLMKPNRPLRLLFFFFVRQTRWRDHCYGEIIIKKKQHNASWYVEVATSNKRYSAVENGTSKFGIAQRNGIRKTICQRTIVDCTRVHMLSFIFSFPFFSRMLRLFLVAAAVTIGQWHCLRVWVCEQSRLWVCVFVCVMDIVAAKHHTIKINEFSGYNQHNVCLWANVSCLR